MSNRVTLTRALTTAKPNTPTAVIPAQVHISKSLSPYCNLAYEDWLFTNTPPAAPLLFLYRNRPSVIIGRNQNPWKETSPSHLKMLGIALVRRRSGGGAVYHDEGNTNYSIMLPPAHFSRPANAALVLSAVHALGVPQAKLNERNDIFVGDQKIRYPSSHHPDKQVNKQEQHVSGSAYKMTIRRSYHHGTMLLTSSLSSLRSSLRVPSLPLSPSPEFLTNRGVESVRSPVGRLADFAEEGRQVEHEGFVREMERAFRKRWGEGETRVVGEEQIAQNEGVKKKMDELETWDWTYGQTPLFEVDAPFPPPDGKSRAVYAVHHGIIQSVTLKPPDRRIMDRGLTSAAEEMVGQRWNG